MPAMKPISAAELTAIRANAAAVVCDQDCVIQRATSTPDAYGTETESSPTTIATTVAGMSTPTAGQVQAYASKIGALKAWQVQLPYGTDVREEDLLLIAGHTLTVQADLSPQSYNSLATVLAVEVS